MSDRYLFLFTIGPVQSFISQARKTQDLYAGSQLLADLIHCALTYIQTMYKDKEGTIIYPFYNEDDNSLCTDISSNNHSYPNRIVLKIKFKDDKEASVFGKTVENIIRNSFLSTASINISDVIVEEDQPIGICEQLKSFLEVYWVGIPYDEQNENYVDKFKELESRLASIKNFRQIKQLSVTEIGRKCNVDGEYNVKIYRKNDTELGKSCKDLRTKKLFNDDNFIIKPDYNKIKLRHIQPGEGLSAISFFKRLYRSKGDKEQNFPSTAAIALLNLENRLSTEIKNFEECFNKDCYDEQMLFDDNLNLNYFKKNFIYGKSYNQNGKSEHQNKIEQERLLKESLEKHGKIIKKITSENLVYTKYYALLRFDGDSVGSLIAKSDSVEKHQQFSGLLIDFAKKATKILDGHKYIDSRSQDICIDSIPVKNRGRTIYAGGDDFLGFVNLDCLFDTIKSLQVLFKEKVSDEAKKILGTNKDFTFSMGVVIAHYKTPLNEVVKKSKALEENAKKYRKDKRLKNNTGISLMTSSSILAESYFENDDWEILELLTEHLKKEDLSSKFIFSFAREMELLNDAYSFELYQTLIAAQKTELSRLMCRAASKKFNGGDQIELKELVQKIQKLLIRNAREINNKETKIDIQNFVSFLKIADNLSSKLKTEKNEEILENTPI